MLLDICSRELFSSTSTSNIKRINYLAGGFNSFAKGSAAGLAVEDVCDEEILRGVHYESALLHVLSNTEERQITHPTFGDELFLLKYTCI